jgi:DDE superfamily endonuclease/Tc5 transposase DNA-binding domain
MQIFSACPTSSHSPHPADMNKMVQQHEKEAERELKVQAVIEGVRLEKYRNVTEAAKALGIPKSTVYHRINGRRSRSHAHEHQQRLTWNQESALISWIKELAANGYPPRHPQVHEMAEEIRRYDIANLIGENDITRVNMFSLGQDWVRKRFLPRYPDLRSVTSTAIDSNRVKNASVEVLQSWFDTFEKVVQKYGIEEQNIYNMDESGFSIGTVKATRVITSAADRRKWQAQPGRQEWVSVVECIGADGTDSIPPLVIFKGQSLSSSWISQDVPKDWQFSATLKGWTSNIHGVEWLRRCFDPATHAKANGQSRLLICDGHGSHVTGNFIVYCMFANIVLLILPPHTSHLTQPLDVSIFGPLKTHLTSELHGLISMEIARVQKFEWLNGYVGARSRTFNINNILSAFSGAGLIPFDPQKVIRQLVSAAQNQPPQWHGNRDSTPDLEQQSPLDNIQLTSSPIDITPFRSANKEVTRLLNQIPSVPIAVRRHISLLSRTMEKFHTKSVIKQKENSALKEVLGKRQRMASGKRVILKNVHCVTRTELAVQIIRKDRENAAKAAKRKAQKKTATEAAAPRTLNPAPPTPIEAATNTSIDPSLSLLLDTDASDSDC